MSVTPTSVPAGSIALRGVSRLAAHQDLVLVAIIIMTVLMMVLPMPTIMADGLIALDIGVALVLILLTLYVKAATEFSTLPSLILVTTAFRLSISITTSRLVLVQGDAGAIIRTFGEFVIAGNVVVGLVVYLIITVVQFVVITKGAERVAEVAARFTLDALPGKQSSIDTDVRNGELTQAEARRRRALLEKESQLYGAMDGAMKFVKGDAIASLVIIAVNLIGGIAIGCLQRGMPIGKAVQSYSLLAVGDGLIAQIPALLISLTAGLIVTRASAEDGGNLGEDIVRQITAYGRPMQIAGIVLAGLGMVPGFPALLFIGIGLSLAGTGVAVGRINKRKAAVEFQVSLDKAESAPEAATIILRAGSGFIGSKGQIDTKLKALRRDLEADLGLSIPRLRFEIDEALPLNGVALHIDGLSKLRLDETDEELMMADVRRQVLLSAADFIGIQETQALLSRVEPHYGDLLREATKAAPLPRLADVLRRLVAEQVSIVNMRAVLEAVAENGGQEPSTTRLTEAVRIALRKQLCLRWASPAGVLSVIITERAVEEALRAASKADQADPLNGLGPDAVGALIAQVRQICTDTKVGPSERGAAVLLTSPDVRMLLRSIMTKHGLDIAVLSHAELASDFTTKVAGKLSLPATTKPTLVAPPLQHHEGGSALAA